MLLFFCLLLDDTENSFLWWYIYRLKIYENNYPKEQSSDYKNTMDLTLLSVLNIIKNVNYKLLGVKNEKRYSD
jgi:hypothetical protein